MATVRQPAVLLGRTQASTVIPVVRASAALCGTSTLSSTPSNDSAPPCLPLAVQVAPDTVPLEPVPLASRAVEPEPSSKP
jgi:hypothetical protein